MSKKVDLEIFTVKIQPEKITKFKQWCQEKQLDINQVVCQLIDSYLEQNLKLNNDLINSKNYYLSASEFELMIIQALQPLVNRIEILEQKLQDSNGQFSETVTENIAQNQEYFNQSKAQKSETILPVNSTNQEDKITYLPRHQIWQMLKQTDYIKSCGYDSFLAATPDEFIDYGIFFDRQKKRYYIKS